MWGIKMGRIQLYYKVLKYYILGNIVTAQDIGSSYNRVSGSYNEQFLNTMQKYNVAMLSQLNLPEEARVLDLACGTGFNSEWLLRVCPKYQIDAVDISEGMLKQAERRLGEKANLFKASMLDFLKGCEDGYYDRIVCSWALKYQPPAQVLKECKRVLKAGGQLGLILNSKNTLPEVRKVYKHLLIKNSKSIKKLMLELPNPQDERQLGRWLKKAGFQELRTFRGMQKFSFDSTAGMTEWMTSTGALAGFDVMVDLRDKAVQGQISELFIKYGMSSVTHDFVWGIAKK